VMTTLGQHLTYRWMLASVWDGAGTPLHPRNVVSKWKPILVYSKGNWQNRGMWVDLSHVPSKEKDWHPWQQPLQEVEMLVRYFSAQGDLIVDPCGGGFTTAVACQALGRCCVSCDVDKQAVAKGQQRLSEVAAVQALQPQEVQ
jgi:DNA modification methylase